MQLTVKIKSDNADVVRDGDGDASFAVEALRTVAERIENGEREGIVRDVNGNKVGAFWMATGETED